MKNWCYINIPNWQDHQAQFQQFVLERTAHTESVYNFIEADDFVQHNPLLANILQSKFGTIERLMIFKMTHAQIKKLGHNAIHKDSNPGNQQVRLNWPVLNPKSVITKFFSVDAARGRKHLINPPFNDHIVLYDPASSEEIDQVCIDQPVAFNILQPHSMFEHGTAWPRIMCSFNFDDSGVLEKYLEITAQNH